jgi:hypothetical protein
MKRRLAFSLLLSIPVAMLVSTGGSAHLVGFQTHNHDVGCIMDGKGVRCDARNPQFDPGPPPANCDLDYGQGVFLGRHGQADFVCAGDTTLADDNPVLNWRHGDKVKEGRFHCRALDVATIKCRNKRNRYGFVISRYDVHFLDSSGFVNP